MNMLIKSVIISICLLISMTGTAAVYEYRVVSVQFHNTKNISEKLEKEINKMAKKGWVYDANINIEKTYVVEKNLIFKKEVRQKK